MLAGILLNSQIISGKMSFSIGTPLRPKKNFKTVESFKD